ncbi:hypothetical protein [Treponema sp.]|uniref:hypothetical protein n=1 Tax=Treponema sp. TaxID=166 RepID=UPI00298E3A39|nr:hypothetical protein [Treponema sp.]
MFKINKALIPLSVIIAFFFSCSGPSSGSSPSSNSISQIISQVEINGLTETTSNLSDIINNGSWIIHNISKTRKIGMTFSQNEFDSLLNLNEQNELDDMWSEEHGEIFMEALADEQYTATSKIEFTKNGSTYTSTSGNSLSKPKTSNPLIKKLIDYYFNNMSETGITSSISWNGNTVTINKDLQGNNSDISHYIKDIIEDDSYTWKKNPEGTKFYINLYNEEYLIVKK